MTVHPATTPEFSAFDGRMAEWRNDDLLLSETQRELIDAEFPGVLAVFDFPELRALFDGFDGEAGRSRRRRQRSGLAVILVTCFGALVSAILPMIDLVGGSFSRFAFLAAASLSIVGMIWAAVLIVHDPHKDAWLEHRLRTERLRQFRFQFLIANAELGARAMKDQGALVTWRERREAAFRHFRAWLGQPMASELGAVLADVNRRQNWFQEAWQAPQPLSPDADMTEYLMILRRLRIDVQLAYVREKLADGIGSPKTRWQIAQRTSWSLTLLTVLLTAGCAFWLSRDLTTKDSAFAILTSLIAIFGVASIAIRVVSEGLQLRSDTERYEWYADAVREIQSRFNDRSPLARLSALREMEEISYREMREFLKAHNEAKFNLS